jgi:toxin ParE1/3/4
MNYDFHPEAEEEFIEQTARYESEVSGLGVRFGEEVNRVIELLLENPNCRCKSTLFRAPALSALDCVRRRR